MIRGFILNTYAVLCVLRYMPRRTAPHASGLWVEMSGLFAFTKHDKESPGAQVEAPLTLELRRLANLFLLSGITLVVLLLEVFARALDVTFIPQPVYAVAGLVFLVGWAATLVYGIYVTFTSRRWGWLVLCAIPLTCVPASVAYAWIRRQEIERAVLGDGPAPVSRQRRGGRKKR